MAEIAGLCNVPRECVIENRTLPILYQAPLMLEENGLADIVCRRLALNCGPCDLTEWKKMLERVENPDREVNIAMVGKYIQLHDAYPVSYTHLHAELEFVAGEGKGGSAVPVRGIFGKMGQGPDPQQHFLLLGRGVNGVAGDGFQDFRKLIAQKHRNDGGRGFLRAQPVVVAGAGHRAAPVSYTHLDVYKRQIRKGMMKLTAAKEVLPTKLETKKPSTTL